MKSIITTFALVFLMTGVAIAQNANIGIKGGLNAYTINNDVDSNNDLKIGFHLGLLAHFHLADQFALQPEIIFSTQGAKYTLAGSEFNLNLNYINIPVLFQFMFDNGFRLQAGPQIGILASANSELNNNSTDIKDDFEPIDLGLSVGVSYINPESNFGIDLRYNHGLSNINASSNVNAFNRGLQAGVFYLFNHK
jgi:hypothetical protein